MIFAKTHQTEIEFRYDQKYLSMIALRCKNYAFCVCIFILLCLDFYFCGKNI